MILKTTYLQSIHSVAILIQGVHEMHFGDGVVKQKKAVWPVQGKYKLLAHQLEA